MPSLAFLNTRTLLPLGHMQKDNKAAPGRAATDASISGPLSSTSNHFIPRTSSEQQLSRLLLAGSSSGIPGAPAGAGLGKANSASNTGSFSSITPRPSSASFSTPAHYTCTSLRAGPLRQHSPSQGNSSQQLPAIPGVSAESAVASPSASQPAPPKPSPRPPLMAGLVQEDAALPLRPSPSTSPQKPRPAQPALVWPEPLDPAPSSVEAAAAAVPLVPRKGRQERAKGAASVAARSSFSRPMGFQADSRRDSGAAAASRRVSPSSLQQQQPQPLPLTRAGTAGSDGTMAGGAAAAAGDAPGEKRLSLSSRSPSITAHGGLPFQGSQGLSALKTIGAACRRRSSLFSCGSNEEQRVSAQGMQARDRGDGGRGSQPGRLHVPKHAGTGCTHACTVHMCTGACACMRARPPTRHRTALLSTQHPVRSMRACAPRALTHTHACLGRNSCACACVRRCPCL